MRPELLVGNTYIFDTPEETTGVSLKFNSMGGSGYNDATVKRYNYAPLAPEFPGLLWQTSDVAGAHTGIRAWLAEAGLANVLPPLTLDVCKSDWPSERYDAVFSSNTAHWMSWPEVECLFSGVGKALQVGGVFCLYGAFNYRGAFTSESNARFDRWLRARNPSSGIRDFEAVDELARKAGMALRNDYEMPANNRMLVWFRTG